MSPDEKYMLPNFNSTNEDMTFRPLLDELGLKNVMMGWIPVVFPKNSMVSSPIAPIPSQGLTGSPSMNSVTGPQPMNSMNTTMGSPFQYDGYMNGLNNIDQSNSNMIQALRDFDLDLDEETDLSRVPPNRVDNILRDIERNNPGAFSLLQAYRIPNPIIKLMVRRIIKLTLEYCKDDKYDKDGKYGR